MSTTLPVAATSIIADSIDGPPPRLTFARIVTTPIVLLLVLTAR
jgi:hypothetical protein